VAWFYKDEEFAVLCEWCADTEEDKKQLTMGEIPSGIFRCGACDGRFIVYDGLAFMEYE